MRRGGGSRGGTRSGPPQAVFAILQRATAARGWGARLSQQGAVAAWPAVAGAEIARHTAAVAVRGGVLVVAVRSAAWGAQLTFFRSELLRRLQRTQSGLRDIAFRVGLPAGVALGSPAPEAATAVPNPPDAAELRAAHDVARPAGTLAPVLMRLYLAAAARRRRLGGK